MSLKVPGKVCGCRILHRLFELYILCLIADRIYLYITRNPCFAVCHIPDEAGVIKRCHFHRLPVIINLGVVVTDLILADHIGQRANGAVADDPCPFRVHQGDICDLFRLFHVCLKFLIFYLQPACIFFRGYQLA